MVFYILKSGKQIWYTFAKVSINIAMKVSRIKIEIEVLWK